MAEKESEHLRMGAAISFAVIILVIGIPLWWKTTEVYRVPLPNDRIAQLKQFDYKIAITISVSSLQLDRTNSIILELTNILKDSRMFHFKLKSVDLTVERTNVLYIEKQTSIHPTVPGEILLIEMPGKYLDNGVVVGNRRTIYFTRNDVSKVGKVLDTWILQSEDLLNTVLSALTHRSINQIQKRVVKQDSSRMRASPEYDLIFSTISPQPEKVKFDYDQEAAVTNFFAPLVSQLSPIANHRLKSQWLYFVELGQNPKLDGRNNYVLTHDQLPHIISPLEKKLGSGVSKHPCLHFITYTSLCEEAPLYMKAKNGSLVDAVLSPRWGGIQLLNPGKEHCDGSQRLTPQVSKFMTTFLIQLRVLLGITDQYNPIPGAIILPLSSVKLRDWELDVLFRLRTVEQMSLAQMTLQSLSQLLEEISNIVINEEVGASVSDAVHHVELGQSALHEGDLEAALTHSKKAFKSAENAFTHPSLLALLYFPDDQKYAVYIPLFIPIMIPVLLSMKSIKFWKRILYKKSQKLD